MKIFGRAFDKLKTAIYRLLVGSVVVMLMFTQLCNSLFVSEPNTR